jgi:O-acetyl-ADP-ribose deacetylase (regulator of RNase III)
MITINNTKLSLIVGDITKQKTDAIVNAANSSLLGGGGVDGAIHRAGGRKILEECIKIREKQGGCETGEAVITTGGNLPAKYVIHTVGPVWRGGNKGQPPAPFDKGDREAELLANCYTNSLKLAMENGIKTISFPAISTGVYGYPIEQAAIVALRAVIEFVKENDFLDEVVFVLYKQRDYDVYEKALNQFPG